MARSEITVAKAGFNTSVAVTKDAITLADDHYIDMDGIVGEKLGIFIENSSTVAGTFLIKAGDNFSEVSLGDLTVALPASGNKFVAVETSRFLDSDGYILIDGSSTGTTTGTITAFSVA